MKDMIREIVDTIEKTQNITIDQLGTILDAKEEDVAYLYERGRAVGDESYGKKIFVRGLIEFTNYCKNDCLYCGIRRGNHQSDRFRLTQEEILSCCQQGYSLGFRTFVLQGGEDPYFTDDRVCQIVSAIREKYPDCAITLSIGEKSRESYERYFKAGANRFLLRHETADEDHYKKLHPTEMSFSNRMRCLKDLKEIGYQVGCGFMVGSPNQTRETLFEDLQFIRNFGPHMVGIGPFIPHHATPFAKEPAGAMEDTLRLLSIIRLMNPKVLLPSTTALGTIHPMGREKGILAGGNVVMPNLSPAAVRGKYELYDNKIHSGDEAAEGKKNLEKRMAGIGYQVVVDRGDYAI